MLALILNLSNLCPCAVAQRTLSLAGPPVITVEPVGTVLEAGATAVLDCQARGEPPPAIGWSRQGQPLLGDDRVTLLPNGSLRIAALQREDTSEYECVARNLLGSVLVTAPLTVQGRCTKHQRVTLKLVDDSINLDQMWSRYISRTFYG